VKNFERWAISVLNDVVMGGKTRIDEGPQVFTDGFASVPICHAQVAHCILGKAVHAFGCCGCPSDEKATEWISSVCVFPRIMFKRTPGSTWRRRVEI
jgi:hypothetical protein